MSNRIQGVTIRPTRLTPTEAELLVEVRLSSAQSTVELRGRLHGPHCAYATTVEVAYPLRGVSHLPGEPPALLGRALIPEPCWWDPQSPFLYVGRIELWEAGRRIEEVRVRCGLHSATAASDGLTWNGRPLALRAVARRTLRGDELPLLRATGVNLVVVDAGVVPQLHDAADRVGVLLAGRAEDADALARDPQYRPYQHPSVLGFVAGPSGDGPVILTGGRGTLDHIPLAG